MSKQISVCNKRVALCGGLFSRARFSQGVIPFNPWEAQDFPCYSFQNIPRVHWCVCLRARDLNTKLFTMQDCALSYADGSSYLRWGLLEERVLLWDDSVLFQDFLGAVKSCWCHINAVQVGIEDLMHDWVMRRSIFPLQVSVNSELCKFLLIKS